MPRRRLVLASLTVALAARFGAGLLAQAPAPVPVQPLQAATPDPAPGAPVAVKIDILLTRVSGGKTLSSLPYSLNAAEGKRTSLRLGSSVPIPRNVVPQDGSGAGVTSYSYQSVGSNIDCDVQRQSDGRYRLTLAMEDSSVAEGPRTSAFGIGTATTTMPVIRTYSINTLLILRDGEATTFNVATDKVSGDTIRAEVTVTALK